MNPLRIRTVQGIGDLFWVLSKLLPFVEVYDPEHQYLHLVVLTIDNACEVQTRAREFLSLFPRLTYEFEQVSREEYARVAALKPRLPERPQEWEDLTVDYCLNRWLEEGHSLYTIDGWPVKQFIDLGAEAPAHLGGLCLFVAGQKLDGLWTMERWAEAAEICLERYCHNAKVVSIIGASWDVPEAKAVQAILESRGIHVLNYAGALGLRNSLSLMRASELFLGFQSGLSVLAENYDVRNIIVYYQHLRSLIGTWRKPRGSTTAEMTFDDFDLLKAGQI